MMQQIANVDSPCVSRELGAILVQRVVEFKFALFGKNHDCHGRELFGHGREFELRIGRDGAVRLEVRKAEGCLPVDPAFADEDRDHTRGVGFPVWRDERVQTRVDRLRLDAEDDEREYGRELQFAAIITPGTGPLPENSSRVWPWAPGAWRGAAS